MEIPEIMTQKGPDARTMSFQVCEHHSFCSSHLSLEGAPTKCQECKEVEENNKIIEEHNKKTEKQEDKLKKQETGKLIRKIRLLTKKIKKIGTFMEEFVLPTMRKCRCHQLLVAVLGRDI